MNTNLLRRFWARPRFEMFIFLPWSIPPLFALSSNIIYIKSIIYRSVIILTIADSTVSKISLLREGAACLIGMIEFLLTSCHSLDHNAHNPLEAYQLEPAVSQKLKAGFSLLSKLDQIPFYIPLFTISKNGKQTGKHLMSCHYSFHSKTFRIS